MEDEIEKLKTKIKELEKRVELYYSLLKIDNEIDFVLKGTYLTEDEIDEILSGNYEV